MKRELPKGAVFAIFALAVLILVVAVVKYFGIGQDPSVTNSTPEELREMQAGKAKRMATDIFGRPRTPSPAAAKFGAPVSTSEPTPR
jgi:hypothetical protein